MTLRVFSSLTSIPVTVYPALANSTARGRPTYPNPTIPTRAVRARILSSSIFAVVSSTVWVSDMATHYFRMGCLPDGNWNELVRRIASGRKAFSRLSSYNYVLRVPLPMVRLFRIFIPLSVLLLLISEVLLIAAAFVGGGLAESRDRPCHVSALWEWSGKYRCWFWSQLSSGFTCRICTPTSTSGRTSCCCNSSAS